MKGTYMPQQLYNQIVTLLIMIFFMVVFLVSVFTGKNIDVSQLVTLIIPALMQVAQMFNNSILSKAQVQSESAAQVAAIQNGKH